MRLLQWGKKHAKDAVVTAVTVIDTLSISASRYKFAVVNIKEKNLQRRLHVYMYTYLSLSLEKLIIRDI